MSKRRTHPGFLSDDEAAREKKRVEEMVRGFSKRQQVTNIGETNSFVVDYDAHLKLVLVYGKEIPADCNFKIGLNETETSRVIDLLVKARAFFKKMGAT